MMTAGLSSASISSTVMVSAAVMAPLASSVTWDMEYRFPFRVGWISRPVGCSQHLAGRLRWPASWLCYRLLIAHVLHEARLSY